jgi:two-component system, NarL family, response regulator
VIAPDEDFQFNLKSHAQGTHASQAAWRIFVRPTDDNAWCRAGARFIIVGGTRSMKVARIRILVADDHPLVRDGIVSLVSTEKDMQVVAQAADGVEAVELARKHKPDIVLLDLRMPRMDGLEVLAQFQALRLCTRVIVLTTFESEKDVHISLKAGARGYLLKDATRAQLLDALRRVHRGETSIPPSIGEKLVQSMNHPELSPRELEILQLVAQGKSNKEVGDSLGIAEGTVKSHVKNMLGKLKVPGRTAMVREAVKRGFVRIS